jgi:hypothetical protein
MWIPPSPLSLAAFLAVVLAVTAAIGVALVRAGVRPFSAVAGLAALLALSALASGSGVLEGSLGPVPGVTIFLLGSLGIALAASLSPLGAAVARTTPLWALVLFQAFRLPLELVLHAWAGAGTVPPQMTWSGENLDVITGLLAPVVALLAYRGRALGAVVAFDVAGAILLLNVLRVALLSTPGPLFSYTDDPPILLAFHFPTGWIVPVCVGGALAGHVVLTRAILARLPRSIAARA